MSKWIKPSGVEINLNDLPATEEKARSLGWRKEGEQVKSDDDKDKLVAYAKEKFNVVLDKRKSVENLAAEIEALENDNSQ